MGNVTQINQHGITDDVDQQLRELLAHAGNQPGVRHAVLAVERLDRSVRWIGATGDAHPDGTPMTVDTPYWIASVTKLYIAASIFKLIEQGELQLRTPLTQMLPGEMLNGLHRIGGADYTDMITIQHLLGHSSGLPDFLEEGPEGEPPLLDAIAEEDQAWTIDDVIQIVREQLTPHFPPQQLDGNRQKIRYSDTNYQLLIQILERVHGASLDDIFANDFYRPFDLTSTRDPGELDGNISPATVWFGDSGIERPKAMRCFRDLVSTPREQLRFMQELVSSKPFDRPDTVYHMMGNWSSFPFSLNPAPKSPVWPFQYGLGAMRIKLPRLFTPLKPVPAVMGHTGVSGSWLFYCPDLKLTVAGTVDQAEAAAFPFRFVPRLVRTLQDALSRD